MTYDMAADAGLIGRLAGCLLGRCILIPRQVWQPPENEKYSHARLPRGSEAPAPSQMDVSVAADIRKSGNLRIRGAYFLPPAVYVDAMGGRRPPIRTAAWERLLQPSLARMWPTCVSTVRWAMNSRSAICRLVRPPAINSVTSCSRLVSGSSCCTHGGPGSGASPKAAAIQSPRPTALPASRGGVPRTQVLPPSLPQ